jgi:predicted dehydrogenase
MKIQPSSRRTFLGAAAISVAARPILGANQRVRVGLIGCGGRGRYVANFMRQAPDVEFVAAADVYLPNAERAREWAGPSAAAFQDFRRLLERKDVDAVLVATPDHWHAAAAILACQAGKDVYVEKPVAHNIREGRKMVDAARRYNRIAMAGMQHRSAPHYREVQRIVQSGELGKVHFVRVWNYVNMAPHGIGVVPDSAPPEGLDWDFYLGPAPQVPFNSKRFLSTFRWFRDYAGGYITDYGTHRFDTVHQVMGATAPKSVVATGRRFHLDDRGDIPDIMQVTYEYSDFILSYEACLLNGMGTGPRLPGMKYYNSRGADDRPHGEAYYGTNGTIFADRIGYELYPENKPEGAAPERSHVNATDATALHAAAFIDAVRTRIRPAADIEVGFRSTTVPLLGNVSYDTGRKLHWDAVKEEVVDDPAANKLLARANPRKQWTWI